MRTSSAILFTLFVVYTVSGCIVPAAVVPGERESTARVSIHGEARWACFGRRPPSGLPVTLEESTGEVRGRSETGLDGRYSLLSDPLSGGDHVLYLTVGSKRMKLPPSEALIGVGNYVGDVTFPCGSPERDEANLHPQPVTAAPKQPTGTTVPAATAPGRPPSDRVLPKVGGVR